LTVRRYVRESRLALDEQYRLILDTLAPERVRGRRVSAVDPTAVSS
jgi:hypothetical protein